MFRYSDIILLCNILNGKSFYKSWEMVLYSKMTFLISFNDMYYFKKVRSHLHYFYVNENCSDVLQIFQRALTELSDTSLNYEYAQTEALTASF